MSGNPQVSVENEPTALADKHDQTMKQIANRLPTILVLLTMIGGWWMMHYIGSQKSNYEEAAESDVATVSDTLRMPEGKLKAGGFESSPAQEKEIRNVHTVPGRLRYDQTKHVNIKTPLDGILAELLVTPGDRVRKGDLMAIVRSPEIGLARSLILKCEKELVLAQQILQREQTLAKNITDVSEMLNRGQSVSQIENAVSKLSLGSYRQDILAAYSKMQLAEEHIAKVKPLVDQGAVAGRIVRERELERQLAETSFRAARDQADFALKQSKLKAEADVSEAQSQLNLARQSLESLLGYRENKDAVTLSDESTLSRLEIRAPIDGSVESQSIANNERVMRGDSLIVLANTESLTVEASIRESDWNTVGLEADSEVFVIVPALDNRVFSAKVRYFGREVQSDTNAIPLIARIPNDDGLLRPGMFVRVEVPIGKARKALAIKAQSLVQHENQEFVFVDMSGGEFKKVNVTTGQASDDWIEVTAGLSPGQLVVTNGTFLLKSELLLQGEGP